MVKPPKKVADRLRTTLPRFQKILTDARNRDVNESDTVTIVVDLLADVFGFDKYAEITSEQAIRGTFCDLAIKVDDQVRVLIEVKAIGLELKESHLRQAVNYGANHGVTWVVLTNGARWEIYRILFERPVGHEAVCAFDILELSGRKAADHATLYLLCREGLAKSAIEQYHQHAQSVNRFVIGAILRSEPALKLVRRELKRIDPSAKTDLEEIEALLPDVLKRDIIESKEATAAQRRLKLAAKRALRAATEKADAG